MRPWNISKIEAMPFALHVINANLGTCVILSCALQTGRPTNGEGGSTFQGDLGRLTLTVQTDTLKVVEYCNSSHGLVVILVQSQPYLLSHSPFVGHMTIFSFSSNTRRAALGFVT